LVHDYLCIEHESGSAEDLWDAYPGT
jgi:hypothetical protein